MKIYRPRIVQEPLTGLRWIARTAGEARLRWYPLATVAAAFAIGIFLGAAGSFMGVW